MLDDAGWLTPFIETCSSEKLPWATTPALHGFATFPAIEEYGALTGVGGSMTLDRVVLALNGAFCLLAGVACVVAPASIAQQAGLSTAPGALTEIRAFHGGLLVGLGCFQIWCIRRRAFTFAGLLMVALSVGGAGLARVLGMIVDRDPTAYHLMNLAIEVTTVAVVTFALSRHRLG